MSNARRHNDNVALLHDRLNAPIVLLAAKAQPGPAVTNAEDLVGCAVEMCLAIHCVAPLRFHRAD
ncbi:unnamed protein product [Fusarium graminearum]|nr:unnamed protein product [Fusarium graminearum]